MSITNHNAPNLIFICYNKYVNIHPIELTNQCFCILRVRLEAFFLQLLYHF